MRYSAALVLILRTPFGLGSLASNLTVAYDELTEKKS